MSHPPEEICGARVVDFVVLDKSSRPTGNCRHWVKGKLAQPAAGLAICKYEDQEPGYFLFYCDERWDVLADTWHLTVTRARQQAEFEYEGVSGIWQSRESA